MRTKWDTTGSCTQTEETSLKVTAMNLVHNASVYQIPRRRSPLLQNCPFQLLHDFRRSFKLMHGCFDLMHKCSSSDLQIWRPIGQQVKGGDSATLLCSGETPPGVLHTALQPSAQEGQVPVGAGPEQATTKIRGLKHLSCEDRLLLGCSAWRIEGWGQTLLQPFGR